MNVNFQHLGSYIVIRLSGIVDSVVAADLEKSLLAIVKEHPEHVIIDCQDLEYINSAGLRVFLLMAKQANPNQSINFCNLSENIHLVFSTIGFDRVLSLYSNLNDAIGATSAAMSA